MAVPVQNETRSLFGQRAEQLTCVFGIFSGDCGIGGPVIKCGNAAVRMRSDDCLDPSGLGSAGSGVDFAVQRKDDPVSGRKRVVTFAIRARTVPPSNRSNQTQTAIGIRDFPVQARSGPSLRPNGGHNNLRSRPVHRVSRKDRPMPKPERRDRFRVSASYWSCRHSELKRPDQGQMNTAISVHKIDFFIMMPC